MRKDRKVWNTGELVMGFAGSYRGRDILTHTAIPQPKPGENIDAYMRMAFVSAVREAFKSGGFLTQFRDGDDSTKTRLLVGVRGRLFEMQSDFQMGELETNYNAIGSGSPEALGSLFSTRDWEDPLARLTEALTASTYFNPGVRHPFFYVQTPPPQVQQVAA